MGALKQDGPAGTPAPSPAGAGGGGRLPWLLLPLLGVFVATQYPGVLSGPFINDDFVFLEKIRRASFVDLWKLQDLSFHWYRPWSRELHYWVMQRRCGPNEVPFHLASLALWFGVMLAYAALVSRLAGRNACRVAVAGVVLLSGWAVPLLWVAGVQELWMLFLGLLTLHAFVRGRAGLTALAFALTVLSKETGVAWLGVAFAYTAIVERASLVAALRRVLPMLAVVAGWALVHPLIGGRMWGAAAAPVIPGLHPPVLAIAGRTLLALVNLDQLPRPEAGWETAALRALPAVGLIAVALLAGRGSAPPGPAPSGARGVARRVTAFGIAWALAGSAPLFLPNIGWHNYYGLVGAMGAWLVLGVVLAERVAPAAALLVLMAVLRTLQAHTPSDDWGTEWYQRRAGSFIRYMKEDLQHRHPSFPPHSRLYFVTVPSQVGFMTGDGPSLRVWYRDSTLSGGYFDQYVPRRAGAPTGADYFFRYDSTGGWVETRQGVEDVAAARAANPRWVEDHRDLAAIFARTDQWESAAIEYRKLALVVPHDPDLALDTGTCFAMAGDTLAAAEWFTRAAALPNAPADARRLAERFGSRIRRMDPP